MISLAAHILESKATKFDPRQFKDQYDKALRKLVQRKAKGHAIEAPEPEKKTSNVISRWTRSGKVSGLIPSAATLLPPTASPVSEKQRAEKQPSSRFLSSHGKTIWPCLPGGQL